MFYFHDIFYVYTFKTVAQTNICYRGVMSDLKLHRIPDPQRIGETMCRYEDTVTCPVCGKGARVYGYIREASLKKAAELKIAMGMSEEDAWNDLSLRMPHNAGIRFIYPKHWYMLAVLPYKDIVNDIDKMCVGHNLRPADGWAVLQDNEYGDDFKWCCKDCAPALVEQLIEENEQFEHITALDFAEQIMNGR
jgi:hypothetical protein